MFFIPVDNALVLSTFESRSQVSLVAFSALYEDFVTRGCQMLFDFHSEFYLLALRTRKAFLRTIFVKMLLKQLHRKLLCLRAAVWAKLLSSIAAFLQMKVK